MQNLRMVEFRSEIFNGCGIVVDTNSVKSVDDIIVMAVSKLYGFLRDNKLQLMIKYLNDHQFKINMSFPDILSKPGEVVFIDEVENVNS